QRKRVAYSVSMTCTLWPDEQYPFAILGRLAHEFGEWHRVCRGQHSQSRRRFILRQPNLNTTGGRDRAGQDVQPLEGAQAGSGIASVHTHCWLLLCVSGLMSRET